MTLPGGGPRLRGYDLDLYLQTSCCGHTLWATDEEHLGQIEALVAADLRERRRHPEYGWANGSLASRLPHWIKAKDNRVKVLAAVGRLREKSKDAPA